MVLINLRATIDFHLLFQFYELQVEIHKLSVGIDDLLVKLYDLGVQIQK